MKPNDFKYRFATCVAAWLLLVAGGGAVRGQEETVDLVAAPFDLAGTFTVAGHGEEGIRIIHSEGAAHAGAGAVKITVESIGEDNPTEASDRDRNRDRRPSMLHVPRRLPAGARALSIHLKGRSDKTLLVPIISGLEGGERQSRALKAIPVAANGNWARREIDLTEAVKGLAGPHRFEGFRLEAEAGAKGTFHLDHLTVAVPATVARSLHASVFSGQAENAFPEPAGGELTFYALVENTGETAREFALGWEVTDRNGDRVGQGTQRDLSCAAGAYTVVPLSFSPADHAGPFVFHAGPQAQGDPPPVREVDFPAEDENYEVFVPGEYQRWVKLKTAFYEAEDAGQVLGIRYEMLEEAGGNRMDNFSIALPPALLQEGRRTAKIAMRFRNQDLGDGRPNDPHAELVIVDADGRSFRYQDPGSEKRGRWIAGTREWQTIAWEIDGWDSGAFAFPLKRAVVRIWRTHGTNWGMRRRDSAGLFSLEHARVLVDDRASLRFSVPNGRRRLADFARWQTLEAGGFTAKRDRESAEVGDGAIRVDLEAFEGTRDLEWAEAIPGAPIRMSILAKAEGDGAKINPRVSVRGQKRPRALGAKAVPADGRWHRLDWPLPGAGQGAFGSRLPQIMRYPIKLETLRVEAKHRTSGRFWIDEVSFASQLVPGEMLGIDIDAPVRFDGQAYRADVRMAIRSHALEAIETDLEYEVRNVHDEVVHERRETVRLAPGASRPIDLGEADLTEGPHTVAVVLPAWKEGAEPIRVEEDVLLPNAAFVVEGFEGAGHGPAEAVSAEAAKDGERGLRWTFDAAGKPLKAELPLAIKLPGYAVRVGMWVRGDGSRLSLQWHGRDAGGQVRIRSTAATVDWEGWRFVDFVLPRAGLNGFGEAERGRRNYPYRLERLVLTAGKGARGRIDIDGVTVCTTVAPGERVVASIEGAGLDNGLAAPGWRPTLRLTNRALQSTLTGQLAYRLAPGNASDLARGIRGLPPIIEREETLELGPGQSLVREMDWQAADSGPFHVGWRVAGDRGEAILQDEKEFLVVDIDGVSPSRVRQALGGIKQLRELALIDTEHVHLEWNELEPHPGRVNYGPFDRQVRSLNDAGVRIIGRLGFTANWNSPGGQFHETAGTWEGDAYAYPKDLRLFYEYVYESVRRYRRHLHHWEVWPYPDRAVEAADMSVEQYVRLVTIARAAIRRADPEATIIMGTTTAEGIGSYLPAFLDKGGELVDVVALDPVGLPIGPEIGFVRERVGEAVAAAKASDPDTQVWITELNWDTATPDHPQSGIAESRQAAYIVRAKILSLAAGADAILLSLWRGEGTRNSPDLVYRQGKTWRLKPAFLAHRVFNDKIAPATFAGEIFLPDRAFRWAECYLFEAGEELVLVAWRRKGQSTLHLPAGISPRRIVDMYGNELDAEGGTIPLGSAPLYVHFDKRAKSALRRWLPAARMDFEDHPGSRWKQNLLDAVDTGRKLAGERAYAAEGRGNPEQVEGLFRKTATVRARVATIAGRESFRVDLSGLGEGRSLVITRRVDLAVPDQRFAIRLNGEEVARYDLAVANTVTADDEKRFHDLVIPVPAGQVTPAADGSVTVTVETIEDGRFSTGLTRFYAAGEQALFLSDIDFIAARQSTMVPRMDENLLGGPLTVHGETIEKGVCTHARAQLAYALGGRFDTFEFQPALEETPDDGSVVFQVLVDGHKVYESPRLTAFQTADPVTVDVSGAKLLELRLDDGGDGIEGDWGVWGNARLAY